MHNYGKKVVYDFFLRTLSFANLELIISHALSLLGIIVNSLRGIDRWRADSYASTGNGMLWGLTIILGTQMSLVFLQNDISDQPTTSFLIRISSIQEATNK